MSRVSALRSFRTLAIIRSNLLPPYIQSRKANKEKEELDDVLFRVGIEGHGIVEILLNWIPSETAPCLLSPTSLVKFQKEPVVDVLLGLA